MRAKMHFVLAAALAAAGCSGGDAPAPAPSAPAAVARVVVSPDSTTVEPGKTIQLTARVEDASGNPVSDRTLDWISYDVGVATVNGGVVTGVGAGTATITATTDGKRGSARVTVAALQTGPAITAVATNPFVEGQTATINGSGFGFVPSNLRVTVDGAIATVSATTGTSIQIVVPQFDCKPARTVDVQVRLLASNSNVFKANLQPAQRLDLPVGQQMIIADPTKFCIQFGATAASEAYLVGVQSTLEDVKSLTPATLSATVATPAGDVGVLATRPLPPESRSTTTAVASSPEPTAQRRRLAHTRAEATLGALDAELLRKLSPGVAKSANATANSTAMSATIPANVQVGNVLSLRVPKFFDQCNQFVTINAVVRAVTPRSVFLEDIGNPKGGFGPADFQTLSSFFENTVYPTDTDYFGTPSDMDHNGRIAIVVTTQVSRIATDYDPGFELFGMVKTVNWFPAYQCPSSNEGEIVYLRTPDPAGVSGTTTGDAAEELLNAKLLLAHEFTHVIQYGLVIPVNGVLQPNWLNEAQATLAEEVVGDRVTGRARGRNYGYDVAFDGDWYRGITLLGVYFGLWLESPPNKAPNAPEQCSFLGLSFEGNNGPCYNNDFVAYHTGYAFLRWLSDQFGSSVVGGEKAIQHALIENRSKGLAAIASVVRVPVDTLLAQWAAALYVDDRVPGAAPRLTFPSWNLFDLDTRRMNQTGRLVPRERTFGPFTDAVSVRGGSTAYFRVSGAGRAATAIRARDSGGGALQAAMRLWVVRLQ